MVINDPKVVEEITAEFAAYDRALGDNDVAALNRFFFDSPFTIRYGNAENLYGHAEIQAFRSSVVASGVGPKRERTVITTYGNDFATANCEFERGGKCGRQSHSWIRTSDGWRIAAAHVSLLAGS